MRIKVTTNGQNFNHYDIKIEEAYTFYIFIAYIKLYADQEPRAHVLVYLSVCKLQKKSLATWQKKKGSPLIIQLVENDCRQGEYDKNQLSSLHSQSAPSFHSTYAGDHCPVHKIYGLFCHRRRPHCQDVIA